MSGYLSGRTSLTTVQTADIAADAVTAAKIPAGAIGSSEIAADAVGSSEIAADAVGASEIAANAVDASEITALTGALDINGQELILDADADTSITADTDDQIDFKISGADDFRMTANTLSVLSGSTLNVDSGATIANSGTATGFGGADAERAVTGILQANANFVDQVIFGPSVDGMSWNGAWSKASVFSSLMLATIEDEGSNTEINIWDLTEQTSGAISTTPLATIDLANAATPTCVAAIMGYVFVGSEDGFAVVDPHSGVWAERTAGWPKTTSTSTRPTLAANTVIDIGLGYQSNPPYDPRTGGYLPTVAAALSGGSQTFSIIKYGTLAATSEDPTSFWLSGTGHSAVVSDNRLFANVSAVLKVATNIDTITANSPSMVEVAQAGSANNLGFSADVDNGLSVVGNDLAYASTAGFTRIILNENAVATGTGIFPLNALINRTYNTGFLPSVARGVYLANSKTADRGAFSNTLTEYGTVTLAAAETSSEIQAVSGLSTSNFLYRANDADFAPTTGDFSVMGWFKTTATGTAGTFISYGVAGSNTNRWLIQLQATTSKLRFMERDSAGNNAEVDTGEAVDDSVWHQFAGVVDRTLDILYLYIDGLLSGSTSTSSLASLTNTTQQLEIGISNSATTPANGADTTSLSLLRYSAVALTATQVRQSYEAEKGMFVASAECLLQSGTTDAVLDVSIDPLGSGKVLVTQTDAITIFDGLVVDSKPTVNSGASEKGKLWGDLRAEQNAANAYVTAPAVDQRQVNEMVRGLANNLPEGVDLGKAQAWVKFDGSGTVAIKSSFNVKSLTDNNVGDWTVHFGIPFKNDNSLITVFGSNGGSGHYHGPTVRHDNDGHVGEAIRIVHFDDGTTKRDTTGIYFAAFGELENE
jgi:hypothetical protein